MEFALGWFELDACFSYCLKDIADGFSVSLSGVRLYEYVVQLDDATHVDLFYKDIIDPSFERRQGIASPESPDEVFVCS